MLIASFDQIHFCMIMLRVPHLPNASSYHKVFTCFICVYLFLNPLHFGVGNHSVTHRRQRGPGWAATLRGCTCEHMCKHLQVWGLSKRMWVRALPLPCSELWVDFSSWVPVKFGERRKRTLLGRCQDLETTPSTCKVSAYWTSAVHVKTALGIPEHSHLFLLASCPVNTLSWWGKKEWRKDKLKGLLLFPSCVICGVVWVGQSDGQGAGSCFMKYAVKNSLTGFANDALRKNTGKLSPHRDVGSNTPLNMMAWWQASSALPGAGSYLFSAFERCLLIKMLLRRGAAQAGSALATWLYDCCCILVQSHV